MNYGLILGQRVDGVGIPNTVNPILTLIGLTQEQTQEVADAFTAALVAADATGTLEDGDGLSLAAAVVLVEDGATVGDELAIVSGTYKKRP